MTWRRAIAAALAAAFCIVALVVVFRSEGLPAVDAASSRATRWFVHQPTGRVILADGYGGRALARLEAGAPGSQLSIAEGPSGAFVINDDAGQVRAIDTAQLRLGPPVSLSALGGGVTVSGVSGNGLVVVDPVGGEASQLPVGGEQVTFDVPSTPVADVRVAPDGSIWSLDGSDLVRSTSLASTAESLGVSDAELSLVGNRPFVLDREGRRARLAGGSWQAIPTEVDPSELVVQVPGPPNSCGWVGADDSLWCVGENGIQQRSTVGGLGIGGSDSLAIAGSAAALVRRAPSAIVRFDWRSGDVLDTEPASVAADAVLAVTATVDLVWIDDSAGNRVWSVHPWGLESIPKNDDSAPLLGETGEILDEGDPNESEVPGVDDSQRQEQERREPDDNGIDDPPVAVDDLVTARGGAPVTVEVTANDYDPDGEAIAVASVEEADSGTVEIGSASSVVYTASPGFVGVDRFEYTIVDGDGTEATAEVVVELLPADAVNQAPSGTEDHAETGHGVRIVVDVLLNDIDPERDALRIGSFSPPSQDDIGRVSQTVSPLGLPALTFAPAPGFSGTAVFAYRPADALGALGDEVDVRVEVAGPDAPNRPPYAAPDAVRVRRTVTAKVPVLVNDVDSDGDRLEVSVVTPLPDRLEVEVQGSELEVTAGVGSADLMPFQYEIDDGAGHRVRGAVLVSVIEDAAPNAAPIVNADTATVVAGNTVTIDALANDSDPDQDPLTVIDVTQAEVGGRAVALGQDGVSFTAPERDGDERTTAVFMYTVTDGNGHEVQGQISVTVLPEALPEPPFARDDSTFTFVDTPVTVDVLRNDGDPSGEEPSLVGSPGCPAGGTASVTAAGLVRFTPPPGGAGTFRCTYEITNSQGLRAGAEIIVSVREKEVGNERPQAVDDQMIVPVGETGSIDPTANDTDPDGERSSLRVVSVGQSAFGQTARNGNTVSFTAGPDTTTTNVRYQVADADGATASATIQITIIGDEEENLPPIANDARREVEAPGGPITFDVSSLISDPDDTLDTLEVTNVGRTSSVGEVAWNQFLITLTPPAQPDFAGNVVAAYTVVDKGGLEATGQLTLTVVPPENRPPVANDDSAEVANSGSITVNVLNNDTDPDGDPLTVSINDAPDPAIGTAAVTSGRIAFTATQGASGSATIGYTVSDGELSDNAVLRITVLPCTDSTPIARDAFLETGYLQPITVQLAGYVTNGIVTASQGPPGWADPVYTPPAGENGNVTITYTASNGCAASATGTVTIDVNQQPVAQPQQLALGKNESRTIPVTSLAGDDEPLVITGSTGAPAWVTTTPDGVVIAPPGGTVGTVFSWTTTVQDPGGLTAAVPISVSVSNLPPVAANDLVDASETTGPFMIVANDSDPDDPNSSLRIQSLPSVAQMQVGNASLTLMADGRRILVDTSNGQGIGGFEYTVVDPSGATATALVGIIGPPIPPPTTTTTTTTTTLAPTTTRPQLTIPPTTSPPTTVAPQTTAGDS